MASAAGASIEAIAKPKRNRAKASDAYPKEFEAAWQAFPKVSNSQSKANAFKAWGRIDEATRARLPQAIGVYAKDTAGSRYVQHMSTWLNARVYEAILEGIDKTTAAKPAVAFADLSALTDDEWRQRIDAKANGMWMQKDLGPSPASPACIVPKHIVGELGLANAYDTAGVAVSRHTHPFHLRNTQLASEH